MGPLPSRWVLRFRIVLRLYGEYNCAVLDSWEAIMPDVATSPSALLLEYYDGSTEAFNKLAEYLFPRLVANQVELCF